VAASSHGITLSFAGSALVEILNVSVDGASCLFVDTTDKYSTVKLRQYQPHDQEGGTVSASLLSKGPLSGATFGTMAQGGTTILSCTEAFLENLAFVGSVGELQQYQASFRLSGSITL
jgi:hypothetical protein